MWAISRAGTHILHDGALISAGVELPALSLYAMHGCSDCATQPQADVCGAGERHGEENNVGRLACFVN